MRHHLRPALVVGRRRWRALPLRLRQGVALTLGFLLIVTGLALSVLPGPFTIPLLIAGTVVLSSEFAWAQHLLHRLTALTRHVGDQVRAMPARTRIAVAVGIAVALATTAVVVDTLVGVPWIH